MHFFKRLFRILRQLRSLHTRINKVQEALGRIEMRQIRILNTNNIPDVEFKVYSQWGEDGIIQYLINNLHVPNKTFVEFGVENYLEANTRFLLLNNNWSGLVLDGSEKNISFIKEDLDVSYAHDLKSEAIFITAENINDILIRNNIQGDIGLLSIDVDGNDYWIWNAISVISPRIVICEYNSLFGPKAKISTPYNSNFYRGDAHYSNVYYGASISALEYIANQKGYSLVAGNSAGNNVFFVRNDVVGSFKVLSAEEAYVKTKFKEAKDKNGKLTYQDFESMLNEIKSLEIVEVDKNLRMTISKILNLN